MIEKPFIIDALQYCKWSKEIFHDMNRSGVAAVHVTICYHENFPQTIKNISVWNRYFENFSEHIVPGRTSADIREAHKEGRTAIILGFQNCSAIEGDIGLIEIFHQLGVRFMQLSYNNQSLLATGCYEDNDSGITRMGREAIREMNRLGMIIDMSHSSKRSTLDAIDFSDRPIAISHANPSFWHPSPRNKTNEVIKALAENRGMFGFSLYPHHLNNGSNCSIEDFCTMVARTAELMGTDRIGFGSDLCQNQPDTVVGWMRNGTWTLDIASGSESQTFIGFPTQPQWFQSNLGFSNILLGLRNIGFSDLEVAKIAGGNWLNFFDASLGSYANIQN
tara:strand:- start:1023 stop:2024 length:1002 start_codon:yes stop_codon:yes gene_type:complete